MPVEGAGQLHYQCGMAPARRIAAPIVALMMMMPVPAGAIDPPYQAEMERLSEILGSLYFLQPLCQPGVIDWRSQMAELISLDEPDEDRRQRLAGAFNDGYTAYARLYRVCTIVVRAANSEAWARALASTPSSSASFQASAISSRASWRSARSCSIPVSSAASSAEGSLKVMVLP